MNVSPRVMDVVGLIGRFFSENAEAMPSHEEVMDELQNQGFSSREISDAFRWIERNTLGPDDDREPNTTSLLLQPPARILTPIEAGKLSSDAHGQLLRYYKRGLVDAVLLEEILEKVARSESDEIGVREIRRLTALTLFTKVQAEWRDFLHSTNTLIH